MIQWLMVISVTPKVCRQKQTFFMSVNLTVWRTTMKTLCPKCFSSHVVPVTTANPNFPQSLDPTLLSPAVLASVGASVCKQLVIPPSLGMVIGTIVGIALTNLGTKTACTSYYCRNCNQVFDVENANPTKPQMDIACPTHLVQSH